MVYVWETVMPSQLLLPLDFLLLKSPLWVSLFLVPGESRCRFFAIGKWRGWHSGPPTNSLQANICSMEVSFSLLPSFSSHCSTSSCLSSLVTQKFEFKSRVSKSKSRIILIVVFWIFRRFFSVSGKHDASRSHFKSSLVDLLSQHKISQTNKENRHAEKHIKNKQK